MRTLYTILFALTAALTVAAQEPADTLTPSNDTLTPPADTLTKPGVYDLEGVTVTSRRLTTRRVTDTMNGQLISRDELFRAACCNLGESFVTNPSVDVNYNDATTGAKQIRLLGLAGTYVQMLTETMPNFRGAASPFALGYVPGPWMKSIQVSKGAASVKNGYESITGQINVQYLQPEDEEGVAVNLFGSTDSRFEANADANIHLNSRLSTELLTHYDQQWGQHDGNHDGFLDQPRTRQYNLQNRWAYLGRRYIMHAGAGIIRETRSGGQTHRAVAPDYDRFATDVNTNRYEAYMKHAFVTDPARNGNLALMAAFSMHEQDALYGRRTYRVNEKNVYASLMYETNIGSLHNLSAGLSFNHDYIGQHASEPSYGYYGVGADASKRRTTENNTLLPDAWKRQLLSQRQYEGYEDFDHYYYGYDTPFIYIRDIAAERENVGGAYVQYTLNVSNKFTLMAGLRADHSSVYGTFWTPRMHVKWEPSQLFSLRLSAGKGYRSPHPLAENHYLLASGRTISIEKDLRQEEAWNYGASTAWNIPIGRKTLRLNAEYYYTRFSEQTVVDYDVAPTLLLITNLKGRSYSHTMQVDASYEVLRGLTLLAAYRRNLVRSTYAHQLREKPLTSRYKGLLTASYKTPLDLWQADITLQLNGGGRMPTPYAEDDGALSWPTHFKPYEQLNAQLTRWFRHFSVYLGAENITNYRQHNPIIHASMPWSNAFEPTMVYGPTMGTSFYLGIRMNFGKRL